jgi:aminopeptidase 2
MCKHFGAEGHSSIDITKGREVLPANVKPIHYDLTLEPDFANFTYQGTVTIEYAHVCLVRENTPLTPPPV